MRRLAVLLPLLVALPAAAAPEQVHLSVAGMEEARPVFTVNWLDPQPERDCPTAVPPGATTGPPELVPGPSAGFVYEQSFTGLATEGVARYSVCGEAFTFRAPAASLSPERPFRLVALGDMGIGDRAAAAVEAVLDLDPDMVLHAGDLSYAQGDPLQWKAWFDLVEPAAATRPWMPALGNHETYTGPGPAAAPWAIGGVVSPAEQSFWHQRFALPNNELWYSFEWSGVHIVALDTFTASGGRDEGPLPEGQAEWLEADLQAHQDAPWTIVFLHQPPYSSGEHGDAPRVQEAFVPLFEQYGVDLVVGGHDHTYERSYPLRGGVPAQTNASEYTTDNGVLYLVTGGAGRSLYELTEQQPAWSAARASLYHVTLLEVTPTELRGRFVSTAGDAFEDAWRLQKPSVQAQGERAPVPGPEAAALALMAALAALARRR